MKFIDIGKSLNNYVESISSRDSDSKYLSDSKTYSYSSGARVDTKSINAGIDRYIESICEDVDLYENKYDKYLDQKRAEELGLSQEDLAAMDEKDSQTLRNIYNKTQARSNAKLTQDEKDILDKYNLKRLPYSKSIADKETGTSIARVGVHPANADSPVNLGNYRYNRPQDINNPEINIADRARKQASRASRSIDREKAQFGLKGYNPDKTNAHTPYRNYTREIDLDRDYVNNLSYKKVDQMKSALDDRERAQTKFDLAKDKYDSAKKRADDIYMKQMRDAEDSYDRMMSLAKSFYDTASDPSRLKNAKNAVNRLLNREEEP